MHRCNKREIDATICVCDLRWRSNNHHHFNRCDKTLDALRGWELVGRDHTWSRGLHFFTIRQHSLVYSELVSCKRGQSHAKPFALKTRTIHYLNDIGSFLTHNPYDCSPSYQDLSWVKSTILLPATFRSCSAESRRGNSRRTNAEAHPKTQRQVTSPQQRLISTGCE